MTNLEKLATYSNTRISINTVRELADIIWGKNGWSLAENYHNHVKVYSLDNGQHWHTTRELVDKLRYVINVMTDDRTYTIHRH